MPPFYKTYIPHTEADIEKMLKTIGCRSVEDLFSDIPEDVRLSGILPLPPCCSEKSVLDFFASVGQKNKRLVCFGGCGSYDHIIPAAVSSITARGEFVTAYTPYQPELSQGILKAIFEYQSLICSITGMDVSNASLYDGHTAAAEAVNMAINSKRKTDTVLYSETIHPHTKQVLKTFFRNTGIKLVGIPEKGYRTAMKDAERLLDDATAAVIIQSPNVYGYIEDVTELAPVLHARNVFLVMGVNPISLGVLAPPSEYGADIVFGDIQSLGLSMNFGGPSGGYIAAGEKSIRKMPGRIVGQTVDKNGERAFVLTLQAREQHIKRERASSNICSNQALMALAAAAYLSLIGKEGFRQVSELNYKNAHFFHDMLQKETGLGTVSQLPFFNEFTLELPVPAEDVVEKMAEKGIFAGVPLSLFTEEKSDKRLIVAVTEKRTRVEMENYMECLREVLS